MPFGLIPEQYTRYTQMYGGSSSSSNYGYGQSYDSYPIITGTSSYSGYSSSSSSSSFTPYTSSYTNSLGNTISSIHS
jgi:hypothetical protein